MSVELNYIPLLNSLGQETSAKMASITLSRPAQANAFNPEMMTGITDALKSVRDNKDCRVVVIQGAGKHFSAGADLNWMKASAEKSPEDNLAETGRLTEMFETLDHMPIPTIGVIRGATYGGAVGITACCDFVLATETAKFCLSEVRVGLLPAVILPYVSRKISAGHLRRFALLGCVFGHKEALDSGLVQLTATSDNIEEKLQDEINAVLAASPNAQREYKILQRALDEGGHRQSSLTAETIAKVRASSEGQEGLRSFLDKSKPSWICTLPPDCKIIADGTPS